MFEDLSEAARLALGSWCHVGGSTQTGHTIDFAAASSISCVLNDDPSGAGEVGQLYVRGGIAVIAIDQASHSEGEPEKVQTR